MVRLIIAAGATGVLMLWSWPAEAARRDEDTRGFCQGAPDLCVFVCRGSCPGMSDDYICESRRGRLVVVEGGEQSYFEEDFSLCWHRSRPPDDPLPDPERDHVPGWPGSDEGAMCMGCETKANWCRGWVVKGEDACILFHEGVARSRCSGAWKRGERPRDRYGRPLEPSDSYCANVLDMDDALNDPDEDFDTDPHTRKRLLQARKKCEKKLTDECVEHFKASAPAATESGARGVEVNAGDFFGGSYGKNDSTTWGGDKGFQEACMDLSKQVSSECVTEYDTCVRKASPKRSCSLEQGRR